MGHPDSGTCAEEMCEEDTRGTESYFCVQHRRDGSPSALRGTLEAVDYYVTMWVDGGDALHSLGHIREILDRHFHHKDTE